MEAESKCKVSVGLDVRVEYKKEGHTYVLRAWPGQRHEALRWAGREAGDLMTGLDFDDAAEINAQIREGWPEVVGGNRICVCHACEKRKHYQLPPLKEVIKPPSLSMGHAVFFLLLAIALSLKDIMRLWRP